MIIMKLWKTVKLVGPLLLMSLMVGTAFAAHNYYQWNLGGKTILQTPEGRFEKIALYNVGQIKRMLNLYPTHGVIYRTMPDYELLSVVPGKEMEIYVYSDRTEAAGITEGDVEGIEVYYIADKGPKQKTSLKLTTHGGTDKFRFADGSVTIPEDTKKSFEIWLEYVDSKGKRYSESYYGIPFHFGIIQDRCDNYLKMAAPSEDTRWRTPILDAPVTAGENLCLEYSKSRMYALGAKDSFKYGIPIPPYMNINYIFKDNNGSIIYQGQQSSNNKTVVIPQNAASMELWFNIYHSYYMTIPDSNYGHNYRFNVRDL